MQVLNDTEWEADCVKEVRKVAEQLVETYPCDSCNVEFCHRRCYKMTLWAEKAKELVEVVSDFAFSKVKQ